MNEYCGLDVMNSILFDFNTYKHYSCDVCDQFCGELLCLSKQGGLYGIIRWFKFILRVFDCAMYICLSINIDMCIHKWDKTLSK